MGSNWLSKCRTGPATLAAALLIAALILAACDHHHGLTDPHHSNRMVVEGSGIVVQEDRFVGGISGVNLLGFGTLHIDPGGSGLLTVQTDDNLLPHIETQVVGGILEIRVEGNLDLRPTRSIDYFLSVPSLDLIQLSGSGNIDAPNLSASHLSVALIGSGNIELFNLDVHDLEVRVAGSGNIFSSGGAVEQFISIAGSGNYQGRDLDTRVSEVEVSGSGSVTVRVSELLVVRISGSGSVYYIGHPIVESSVTGSGSVTRLGG